MTKLNRAHGIEVGSKVKVLTDEGSTSYTRHIGKILTVIRVVTESHSTEDLIVCEDCGGSGQWPERFELVTLTNGFDQNGKPTQFNKADLKPFQRVVTSTGKRAIVVEHEGAIIVNYERGEGFKDWDNPHFTFDNPSSCRNNIVEVYAPASTTYKVTVGHEGPLLWRQANPVEVAKAIELAKLNDTIIAAIAARDAFLSK
jgi:hypothetical protein